MEELMKDNLFFAGRAENDDVQLASDVSLGLMIRTELKRQERTVAWLARKLNCDRTNIYDIFKRRSIDTELLLRISIVLKVNFFAHLAELTNDKIYENSTKA